AMNSGSEGSRAPRREPLDGRSVSRASCSSGASPLGPVSERRRTLYGCASRPLVRELATRLYLLDGSEPALPHLGVSGASTGRVAHLPEQIANLIRAAHAL